MVHLVKKTKKVNIGPGGPIFCLKVAKIKTLDPQIGVNILNCHRIDGDSSVPTSCVAIFDCVASGMFLHK